MFARSLFAKSAGAAALLAASIAPVAASAQVVEGARGSFQPSYHLVQLSVALAGMSAEAFEARTKEIASCADAIDLARDIDAEITRNRHVPQERLPGAVQDVLRDLPTGQASPIFSNDGETMRVLVICNKAN
ncbi:hypothetical protein CD351_13805 [Erythrobacter sp. KY5]|uniref:hypothetical protein n=1 Tax=Erythrobacter sp. KY5 TaxID=2011159 RepID=UPI000DBEFA42|nr:hypothetical protein [Erythrobacter sp. KY5]AWW75506.1 hypothetical protein CD351_13805 [Erythrobacter sp. KY5]